MKNLYEKNQNKMEQAIWFRIRYKYTRSIVQMYKYSIHNEGKVRTTMPCQNSSHLAETSYELTMKANC